MANFSPKCTGIFPCILFYLTTLLSYAFASSHEHLHTHAQWLTLLHVKHNKSEVDDPRFFLSPEGKNNTKAELLATIHALQNDKSDDENSYACRFPARAWFLQSHGVEFPVKKCENNYKAIRDISPRNLVLSFPTAHINSPASMFGHTLLRIDSDDETQINSKAINYAAHTDEKNGLIFAFNGIFGLFKGRYSVVPYYKKIQEYNGAENRDIWEYELDFTSLEAMKALLYAIEISNFYSDYFFFSENCSYNILWILQFAKDSRINLVQNFNITATPIETIRELERHGLIRHSLYRHSKMTLINTIFDTLEDRNRARNFIHEHYPMSSLAGISPIEKTKILDIASNDLMVRFIQNKIDGNLYRKNLIKVLKERSTLPKIDYEIKQPFDPLHSDLPNRLMLGISENFTSLSYRPTYHDIYDIERGFIHGAYITFFDFEARHDRKHDESFLYRASILDIRSYATQTFYNKPISWEMHLEGIRLKENRFYARLKSGAGVSYGGDWAFIYFLPQLSVALASDTLWGISPKIGFNINYFENFKIGAFYERNIYLHKQDNDVIEGYITAYLNKHFNIMAKIAKEESYQKQQYWLSLGYKF